MDDASLQDAATPSLQALLEERLRLRQEISDLRIYGHDVNEAERRLRDIAWEIRHLRERWRQAI